MATAKEMLVRLKAGRVTLAEVAADFATRTWSKPKPLTEEQQWGVHDFQPTDDNSPDQLAIAGLPPAQYQVLFNAITKRKSR